MSKERIEAYALDTDADITDAVARYQWNMALAATVAPVLHLVEVAFRNAIYNTGVQTTEGRVRATRQVPCWLDANPSFLEAAEKRDVTEGIRRLGPNRRRTPGHLVGQLGFGFWVRLCNRPYEQGRQTGPRLWPAATRYFPLVPSRYGIGQPSVAHSVKSETSATLWLTINRYGTATPSPRTSERLNYLGG